MTDKTGDRQNHAIGTPHGTSPPPGAGMQSLEWVSLSYGLPPRHFNTLDDALADAKTQAGESGKTAYIFFRSHTVAADGIVTPTEVRNEMLQAWRKAA